MEGRVSTKGQRRYVRLPARAHLPGALRPPGFVRGDTGGRVARAWVGARGSSLPTREASFMADIKVATPSLQALLDAFNAHDVDEVMSFFTEDCVLDMPRGPGPGGRRLIGRQQV